jgi:hypothetical protein
MLFERSDQPVLPWRGYVRRQLLSLGLGAVLVLASLIIGMAGYRGAEGMSWTDAFLNSAMLLGGMGPVSDIHTEVGKIFAGAYALYCGLAIIGIAGVILAPAVHRVLHHFHLQEKGDDPEQ